MRYFKENRQQGFTLIELLIAMALALIIIGALSGAFVSQRKAYDTQEQISEMNQNARAALGMMSGEIKMAGFAPTGYDTAYENDPTVAQTSPMMQRIDSTAARFVGIPYGETELQIIADLNGDGDTSDTDENVTYAYDSTNKKITRTTGGATDDLVENIQSFTFKYLESDGVTEVTNSANVGNIREIQITITARTAEPDPDYSDNSGYRTTTLTSNITPPNLAL